MAIEGRWKEIVGSMLVFSVFLATLTALRLWNLEPATSVQSAIINVTALLVIAAVAYYEYSGGDFINGWILALGPSLAFTVNLFVPVVSELTLFVVVAPLISAAIISGVIAVAGYLLAEGFRRLLGVGKVIRLS
jgi:hypothetical protein